MLDMQSVAVAIDVDNLTQTDIVNILSNNGAWKGLYYKNGQLYISFNAALGGELALGGANNGNGIQRIYDSYGNVIVTADTEGITVYSKDGTPKARMSDQGSIYFKEYYENGNTLRYKGIIVGDLSGLEGVDSTGCGIRIVDCDSSDDVSIIDVGEFGFTYESDVLNGKLFKLNVAKIIDVTEFQKPPKILNCKHITTGGHLVFAQDGATVAYLSSSSKRYKDVQKNLECMEQWYDIEPVWAKYKNGYLADDDIFNGKNMPMFLAEDVEKHMPEAAVYNKDGKIEDWNYRVMIPAMFAMLKQQKSEIDSLKQELDEIKQLLRKE